MVFIVIEHRKVSNFIEWPVFNILNQDLNGVKWFLKKFAVPISWWAGFGIPL
jgi:hypothetical protein